MPRKPPTYRTDIPGFVTRRTSKDYLVVELDLEADPEKATQEYQDELHRRMPSEVAFRREFKRDWDSAAGKPFYPEFIARPTLYIRPSPGLIPGVPVARGWDFGIRNPACVWLQRAPSGLVWFLREVHGAGMDTHEFRDLVLYLSGQRSLDSIMHRTMALEKINAITDHPHLPDPPWFTNNPEPVRFIDFSGHEALIRDAAVEGQHAARTHAAVLAEGGVHILSPYSNPKARAIVMRRFLLTRPDGTPWGRWDPACRDLIRAMGGGIPFAKETKDQPEPDEPAKVPILTDLHDAAGYALCGVAPDAEEIPLPTPAPLTYYEGRDPVQVPADQGFPIHEVDAPTRW